MSDTPVLIAGAGIGGLSAALTCHAVGLPARVIEAAPEIQPLGVGINLLPHSVAILHPLGVVDELLERGVATRELAYFNKHGQPIWTEPRGKFAGYPVPQISLPRAALQAVLLKHARQRLGRDAVIPGHRLTSVEAHADLVAVNAATVSGSSRLTADVLVGADGIHSALRRQFYPDERPPSYSGRLLWRAVSRARPFLTGASMVMIGHQNQKFVAYPIGPVEADGLQPINWIAELFRPMTRREDWNRMVDASEFLHEFSGWRYDWLDVPALITSASVIFEYPMVDRDPVPHWTFGRTTLLGDAAHPMYPIGSNGASQAILDAHALARAFRANGNLPEALTAYEAERWPATSRIILSNRANGPEQCMQLAEERAPQGFTRIEDVIPHAELAAISARYKQTAGFDMGSVALR